MRLLFTLLFLPSLAMAQDTLFAKIFHKSPQSIDLTTNTSCRTSDGKFFIAGQVYYGQQAFLQKLDSVGNEIWIRKYKKTNPQFENFRFYEINETNDGNLLLGGRIYNDLQALSNPLICKLDLNGDTLWTRSFSAVGNYGCMRSYVTEGNQNEYYLIWSEGSDNNLFVSKYDVNGTLIWNYKYPTIYPFQVGGATFDTVSNQLYVSGLDYGQSDNGALFCINEIGDYQWGKIHSGIHLWNSIAINGNIYTSVRIPGNSGLGLARFDNSGALTWLNSYNTSGWGIFVDEPITLEKNSDSTLVMFEKGDAAMWSTVCQINTAGDLLSSGESWMMMTGAHFTEEGGFVLIGNGPMYGVKSNTTPHYGIVKSDSLFNSVDCVSSMTFTNSILPNPGVSSWNTTISGSGIPGNNKFFYDTISAYTEPGCVRFLGSVDELTDLSVTLYPNPGSDLFNLEFSRTGNYSITITDAMGKTISEFQFQGNLFNMNLGTLVSGIYFCNVLEEGTLLYSGKVNVMK